MVLGESIVSDKSEHTSVVMCPATSVRKTAVIQGGNEKSLGSNTGKEG